MTRTRGRWTTSDLDLDEITIYGPGMYPICEMCHDGDADNARFIVHACNSHVQLLEALKETMAVARAYANISDFTPDFNKTAAVAIAKARAAIAAAKEAE